MNSSLIILTIIGMAAVTYIPRMLPFVMFKGKELPPFIQGVLQNVPFATLGALIFPAALLINEGNLIYGIVGAAAAFIIAFLGANVIIVVIGSIVALSMYSMFI
ncbi:AzlD domain-containing protein [Siminovitchia acidinfaciens]|uniref:AzlD domain-containing protein n=1 Tax=Siminovitchia acidinfaciens TaxID=2321395 RepID=A0A429Y1S0_9BACI|nr:AzlD domain-containing protein [Siminovitchia acidinfaciens]RST75191.1 AzlD domain-containing protein [Siminovitchia acidinfaciens]VEF48735.1 branched-chain amino acid transport [Bacillus freudenreichii]